MIFIVYLHTWYFAHFLTLFGSEVLFHLCAFVFSYFFQSGVSCYSPMSGCSSLPFLQVPFSKKPSELAVSSNPPALSASLTVHLKSSLPCISTIHLLEALKQGQVWFILVPKYPLPHVPCCFVHGRR